MFKIFWKKLVKFFCCKKTKIVICIVALGLIVALIATCSAQVKKIKSLKNDLKLAQQQIELSNKLYIDAQKILMEVKKNENDYNSLIDLFNNSRSGK